MASDLVKKRCMLPADEFEVIAERCRRDDDTRHRQELWLPPHLSARSAQGGFGAAAAIAAPAADAFAESHAETSAKTRLMLQTPGVRPIDIHAHYYPQSFFDVIVEDGKRFHAEYHKSEGGFSFKTPEGNQALMAPKFMDLELRLADMDRQGIAIQAVSLSSPMVYWGDEALSHKLAAAWNDGASAAHRQYPTRIVALMSLPMLYPDRAIDELDRASKLPGMRGVYIGTHIDDAHDLDDPLFDPVYTHIEALDLPVFLHPLQNFDGERMQPFYLSNLLGNPFDTAIAASKLIFGGVLDRHPKL